jgi:carboxymethylenebutenolidase
MGKMIKLTNDNKQFPVYESGSKGKTNSGLIVIHEVWGLPDHIKDIADRFATEGYEVVAPDLLSEVGMTKELVGDLNEQLFDPERSTKAQPKLRELMAPMQAPGFGEITVDKIKRCFDYLETKLGSDAKIGVTGFCFGGTYSFSLAVHQPNLKAAVPFYGNADYSVDQLEQIKCPVLAFYGQNDEGLISGLDDLKEKMKEAKVDFTAQVYDNCGHAFFNDTNRFSYYEPAAKDAWNRALDFLEVNLK